MFVLISGAGAVTSWNRLGSRGLGLFRTRWGGGAESVRAQTHSAFRDRTDIGPRPPALFRHAPGSSPRRAGREPRPLCVPTADRRLCSPASGSLSRPPPCPRHALPWSTPHELSHRAACGTGAPPRGSQGEGGHGSERNETHTRAHAHTCAHALPRTGARGHTHAPTPALAGSPFTVFRPGQHPSFWGRRFGGDLGWGLWSSAPPFCVSFMSDLGQVGHPGFHFSRELEQGVGPRNVPWPASLPHWVLRWQLTCPSVLRHTGSRREVTVTS